MSAQENYWAVIPAAGIGARMGADIPKQYLKIREKSILERAIERFCLHPRIRGVVVALAEDDPYWQELTITGHKKIKTTPGGRERCHSVLNSLDFLRSFADKDDWVMVHDAARPCLRSEDIDSLIADLAGHPVGGILALPVRDTMKRAGKDNNIEGTVDREGLWHALTPQMFRLQALQQAISKVLEQELIVTDEAQAMEAMGLRPKLVQGYPDNIKVTLQSDLALAELFISEQEKIV